MMSGADFDKRKAEFLKRVTNYVRGCHSHNISVLYGMFLSTDKFYSICDIHKMSTDQFPGLFLTLLSGCVCEMKDVEKFKTFETMFECYTNFEEPK